MSSKEAATTAQEGERSMGNARLEDVEWLLSLSEIELDLLISLKELAIKRAEHAGVKDLGENFDLRMLRTLGCILLEFLKDRICNTTDFPDPTKILTLLRCCGLATLNHQKVDTNTCFQDIDRLTSANPRRKRMWEGLCEEGISCNKKRRTTD